MTPTRLREALAALHWSQRGLAAILDIDERQVRRWAAGAYPMPAQIAAWLEGMARYAESHPAPKLTVDTTIA